MHLQNEDRCLVCWDASHRIYNCPHRSDKLKEEMEAKKQCPGFRGRLPEEAEEAVAGVESIEKIVWEAAAISIQG